MANKVVLTGNLTKEVELRVSEKGTMFFNNTIAVRKDFKNAQGEYDSDFINIVAFGNTAKYLGDYANKGDKIFVLGSIGTRNYTNKEGNKVYITEVNVESAEILRKSTKGMQTQPASVETAPTVDIGTEYDITDDEKFDLPF